MTSPARNSHFALLAGDHLIGRWEKKEQARAAMAAFIIARSRGIGFESTVRIATEAATDPALNSLSDAEAAAWIEEHLGLSAEDDPIVAVVH